MKVLCNGCEKQIKIFIAPNSRSKLSELYFMRMDNDIDIAYTCEPMFCWECVDKKMKKLLDD